MGSKMRHTPGWVPVRCCGLVMAAALLLLIAWRLVGTPAVAALSVDRDPTFAAALTLGCYLVVLACAAWWLLVTVLVACEAVRMPSGRPALPGPRRTWPGSVRRLLLAGCGVAVATGVAGPALAAGGHADVPRVARPVAGTPLEGLALPDRLTVPDHLHPRSDQAPRTAVVVRPGDSLWRVARTLLPDGAGDAAVDRMWRRIAACNRDRLGPDPDLIFPGTLLRVPGPGRALGKDDR